MIHPQRIALQLSPLYIERIAAAEQVGEQRGRLQERREMVLNTVRLSYQ